MVDISTKYYIAIYWFDQDNSQTNEMKGFLVYFMLSRKLESEEVVVNVVFSFLYETSLKVIIFFVSKTS